MFKGSGENLHSPFKDFLNHKKSICVLNLRDVTLFVFWNGDRSWMLTTDVVGAALLLHLRNESVTFHFEGSDGE
jgi:hypothetical protein